MTHPASPPPSAADDALLFTREHCMQRDAEVTIESMDRGGTFLGTVTILGVSGGGGAAPS